MWFSLDKPAGNGSLFQKWHRSSICPAAPAVTLDATERLRFELVGAFRDGEPGYQVTKLGQKWICELPRRLGSSTALDDACACLASSYNSMVRRNDPSTWINPARYSRALKSLRTSLQSPVEGFSTHTLTACAVLYLVEAIAGTPDTFSIIHHIGGASRLLEARGPNMHEDKFDYDIALHLQGPVLARNVQLGEECFLLSEEWSRLFSEHRTTSERELLSLRLVRAMCSWPTLAKRIREYRTSRDVGQLPDLLSLLCSIRLALYRLSIRIQAIIDEGCKILVGPSLRGDDLVSDVYRYGDDKLPNLVAMHAACSLIVERMVTAIDAQDFVYPTCAPQMTNPVINTAPGQIDIQALCLRIWMTYEHAWHQRPIAAQFMHVPLTASYLYAGPAMQAWIIKAENALDDHHQLERKRFNPVVMDYLAKLYTGEDGRVNVL